MLRDANEARESRGAQHIGKQEHTVSMRGRGLWADMQRIYTAGFWTGRVATSIRCFGKLASS